MSLHEAMDRLFNESVVPSQGTDNGSLALPVNVREEGDAYVITAALPGVRPEDVQIEATGNTVSISGETSDEREVDEGSYVRRERRFGRFIRVLELPVEIDADKAEANFEHGVLTLRIPKSEATKPRQVRVGSGQSQQSQRPQQQLQQSQQQQQQQGQQPAQPQQAKRETGNGRDSGNKPEREPVAATGTQKGSGGSGATG
jgi:HSP20 family protein